MRGTSCSHVSTIERLDTLHTKLRKPATEPGVSAIKELNYQIKEGLRAEKTLPLKILSLT